MFSILLQAFAAFAFGSVVFDVIHYIFHCCIKSKKPWLRAIGSIHLVHHRFYSTMLKVNHAWTTKNLLSHALLEHMTHLLCIIVCLWIFNPIAILLAACVEIIIFLSVIYAKGIDAHHKPNRVMGTKKGGLFVNANYHAMHHIYPNNFYSSYIKILDFILGSSQQLAGKHIAMTGANGALGSHMKRLLEKNGAIVTAFKYGSDYTYDHYEKLRDTLTKTDILFLCHGSKLENAQEANCDSFVKIIELFRSVRKRGLVPLEIWAVGSEIECHPCFGIKNIQVYAKSKRNFARFAHQYFHDPDIQYRHLVHSSFISRMGPGLMTASFAAKMTLFFIKRGFKYVPVTYTGFAYLNYLRFLYKI